jgi:hypothetical protein
MATAELKEIIHQQIDRLEDPQDVQDLLLTVSEFVGQRTSLFIETPELLKQLEAALQEVSLSSLTSHDDIVKQSKEWLIR